ncbi:MAG: HNH endonuclease, partial [Deltaproteobacteria bacterium]|nr:HNH endonuclease [Deltaproteobacteria bacterium]
MQGGDLWVRSKPRPYLVHRTVFYLSHGYLPEQIDHINGIRSDNRIDNLRGANDCTNAYNRGLQSNNTSGVKGVCWYKSRDKWH